MRAVISVIGKDAIGILADVSNACAKYDANIIEVSQTILQDMFAMIMLVDISKLNDELGNFQDYCKSQGNKKGLIIHVMHEDIFNSMHSI